MLECVSECNLILGSLKVEQSNLLVELAVLVLGGLLPCKGKKVLLLLVLL